MNKLIFVGAIFFLSSCASLFHSTKKTFEKGLAHHPYDVIIVPGYPYNETDTTWNNIHKIRIEWANFMYKNGYAKNIIFSGNAVYSPYYEGEIMMLYAQALDIPKENLFAEKNALHSTENVYYSYRKAKDLGFKNIALATDPFQTNNLRRFIKKYKIPVKLTPIVFNTLAQQKRFNLEIDPKSAKIENFTSLKEKETFFQRLKGTFGGNIMWYKEDVYKKKHLRKFRKQNRLIE